MYHDYGDSGCTYGKTIVRWHGEAHGWISVSVSETTEKRKTAFTAPKGTPKASAPSLAIVGIGIDGVGEGDYND